MTLASSVTAAYLAGLDRVGDGDRIREQQPDERAGEDRRDDRHSGGKADAEARRAHVLYNLGNSGVGSPSPAAANCGNTIDESDTMAVASRSG